MDTIATPPIKHKAIAKDWPVWRGNRLSGSLRQMQREPLSLYHSCWRECGDFVRIRALPGFYFYLIAHPDAIEFVLQTNHKNYRKPDSLIRPISLLLGGGIFTSEGEFWRKQRRLMQPAFLKHQVAKLGTRMVDAADDWVRIQQRAPDGQTLDIVPEMMRLALRIASTTLFTTDISADADSIGLAYRKAFEFVSLKMNGRLVAPLWVPTARNRELQQSLAVLNRVILDLIARRRTQPPQHDVLDLLLAAQDEESGHGMTDQQLKDEAVTLLTAGHETTGAAPSWAWYLLSEHPDVQQALYEQVSSHLNGRLPSVDDLPSMPLATAVFEEAMRLYPPAWGVPRETIQEDEICGYAVPPKAVFVVSQYLAHRHLEFWHDPDKFDPERFLPPNNAGRPKFAYFPFGGGPRICIGNHFAMIEGPLVLAAIAQRLQFSLVPNQSVEPDATFTLRPKHGVRLILKKRD